MVQPYVNHIEGESISEKDNAPYIPIFIGKTGTSTSDDDKINPTFTIKTFNSYNDANVTTSAGGLGVEPTDISTNPLLKIVKEYYDYWNLGGNITTDYNLDNFDEGIYE